MASPGPLGFGFGSNLIDEGTSSRTLNLPPGPLCVTNPSRTQIDHNAACLGQRLVSK